MVGAALAGVVIGCVTRLEDFGAVVEAALVDVVIGCVTDLEDEDIEIVNEKREEEEEMVVEEEGEMVFGEGVAAPVVTLMYRELKRGWLEFELSDMTRKKMSPRCRFCDGRPSQ